MESIERGEWSAECKVKCGECKAWSVECKM